VERKTTDDAKEELMTVDGAEVSSEYFSLLFFPDLVNFFSIIYYDSCAGSTCFCIFVPVSVLFVVFFPFFISYISYSITIHMWCRNVLNVQYRFDTNVVSYRIR
jgi:hypothetical protein